MFESVRQDIRIAARLLRKSPVFTLTAALSIAIGIGANTAIFSLVNALLFKGRPGLAEPGRLVDVGRTQSGGGFDNTSYPNYRDLRDQVQAFQDLAAFRLEPVAMGLRDEAARGDAERVYVATVTGNFFDVLGSRAAAGRLLSEEDDRRGNERVTVVLSEGYWLRKYGRDPGAIGRRVVLNGVDAAIVGVAERGFRGTSFVAPDAWIAAGTVPLLNRGRSNRLLEERRAVWLLLVGRLASGATLGQANAQLGAVASRLEQAHPDSNKNMGWRAVPSSRLPQPAQAPVLGFLGVLMVIVALVLAIACANLAGVLLARAVTRRRELTVRLAIGASRGRLARQLITETLLIFALGCAGGLLISQWLVQGLEAAWSAVPFPLELDVRPDGRVLLFAIGVTLASGILSGLVPALHAVRTDLAAGLKDEAAGFGMRRLRLRGALLVAQVALSCLLFFTAAMFARSLQHASRIDPGFDARNVEVVTLDFAMGGYRDEAGVAVGERLLDRARQIPGVTSAALTRVVSLTGHGFGLGSLHRPGHAEQAFGPDWNIVSPDYFETLRIAILRGRPFTTADRPGAPRAIIVNETVAARLWPGEDPIGQRLVNGGPDGELELTVVGVARNGMYRYLGEAPRDAVYVPFAQSFHEEMSLLVRSADARAAAPALRAAVRELDPNLPVIRVERLEQATAIGLIPHRIAAALAGALGLIGLLLAAVGIYGVTAFAVANRTREIGVRVALGAARAQVLRLVLSQGLALAAAGTGIGIVLGLGSAFLLSRFLFGVAPTDLVTIGVAALVFVSVSAVASYVPARAASTIDPLIALRAE
jgi:predicted permease